MPASTVRIFMDFDGTMTREDVGEELFRHFCGTEYFDAVREQWVAGKLSAIEGYTRLCEGAMELTPTALQDFLGRYEIDPSVPRFISWCEEQGFPCTIVSDGSDAYIEPLLQRAGVNIPVISNELRWERGRPVMRFPHSDARCPGIANCKSNHVALLSQDEDLIVYIGDGDSDFEAAQYADFVFARGTLERYCQEQNITFRRFYNFTTVRETLSLMLRQRKLRRRRRAEIHRQQLWARG